MTPQGLRAHIERKFEAAALEEFPFPHMIIRDFFPEDVYAKIIDYNLFKLNAGKAWISKGRMLLNKNTTPYDHRLQINFHKNEKYEAPDEQRAFWQAMTDTFLQDNWFPKLVYGKYPEYFNIRFGEATSNPALWDALRKELFLQRHEPDYSIGPHTDIATRVFTCIFSFADRPGFEEYGTQLLRHKDSMTRCWGDAHHPFDDFTVARTAEYRPNNFLLFFKTRQSFHAVKTITPDVPNQRYGMQFQYYEPRGGVFRDLSNAELMAVNHQSRLAKAVLAVTGARKLVGA